MNEDAEKPRQYANGGIVRGGVGVFLPDNSYVIRASAIARMDLLHRLNRAEEEDVD